MTRCGCELHTAQLRAISRQLSLRSHIWGVWPSSARPGGRMSSADPKRAALFPGNTKAQVRPRLPGLGGRSEGFEPPTF